MSWVKDVWECSDFLPAKSSVGVPDCMIQKQWPKKAQNSQFCFTISEITSQEEQSVIVEGQRVCAQSARHSHRQKEMNSPSCFLTVITSFVC